MTFARRSGTLWYNDPLLSRLCRGSFPDSAYRLRFTAAAQAAANSPRVIEASQVYQSLRVQEVEQPMLYDDSLITYGNALVSCGFRSPQWFDLLHEVYAKDYPEGLDDVSLNTTQQAQAISYADARIQNPSPPPYICQRILQDNGLASWIIRLR